MDLACSACRAEDYKSKLTVPAAKNGSAMLLTATCECQSFAYDSFLSDLSDTRLLSFNV